MSNSTEINERHKVIADCLKKGMTPKQIIKEHSAEWHKSDSHLKREIRQVKKVSLAGEATKKHTLYTNEEIEDSLGAFIKWEVLSDKAFFVNGEIVIKKVRPNTKERTEAHLTLAKVRLVLSKLPKANGADSDKTGKKRSKK